MITLCMDTSHIYLVLALIRDDAVIGKIQEPCWKKQSEEIFPKLQELMDQTGTAPQDIDQIVITKGPGSYTGVRIAMTVAKVFCAMKDIPLYTVGTLQLYAGNRTCRVLTDARGKRAYTCVFENGRAVEEPHAEELAQIPADEDLPVIGDGHLISREDCWPDLAQNFLAVKENWEKAESVHTVVPEYLKSSQAYLLK